MKCLIGVTMTLNLLADGYDTAHVMESELCWKDLCMALMNLDENKF